MSGEGRGRTADVPRATARGPGSGAEAAGIADRVTRGVGQGAEAFAASTSAGSLDPVPRVRLRLPAGADTAEIARAFEQALLDRRRHKP